MIKIWKALFLVLLITNSAFCNDDSDLLKENVQEELKKNQETHEFQAEIGRLMDIIINSLYTQKEIFLRELISNAADALDKIRFLSVSNKDLLKGHPDLEIRVEYDPELKTISVTDSGIGMTKQDLIQNLGTIAKSGTTQFVEAIKGGNLNLIGQFGVGFYSSFLAAQKVTVITKHNDDVQYVWESSAAHEFSISVDPRGNTLKRGTKIIIQLKQDAHEFAEEATIKELIKRYSEFINFPIYLRTQKEVEKEVVEEDDNKDSDTTDDKDDEDSEIEVKDKAEKKTKKIKVKEWEWVLINDTKAIWLRPKEEITAEEYQKFFKQLTKNNNDEALDWVHFKAEGEVEFTALLYIPKKAPQDLFENYYDKGNQLRLYVRRVLINEEFEDLLPKYLNFIRGVIDSDELPLNVNRETLQQLKMLKVISKKLVRKTLELLKTLAEGEEDDEDEGEDEHDDVKEEDAKTKKGSEKYLEFYKEYGKNIKLGIIEDQGNRQKLAKLSRWHSSHNLDKLTSFDEYISRAKPGQEQIYFISGENKETLLKSPILQTLLKKGYEVLILEDPIDEYVFQHLTEYEKKKLVNVAKGDFKIPDDDDNSRRRLKQLKKVFQPLTDWWKKLLSSDIDNVNISQRLVEDPCVVVATESGQSANMERIAKAQAYSTGKQGSGNKRILEINPNHPAIKELLERVKDDPDQETEDLAKVLYDAALINSGYSINDPTDFASRFFKIYNSALGIPRDAKVEEFKIELDEDDKKDGKEDKDDL